MLLTPVLSIQKMAFALNPQGPFSLKVLSYAGVFCYSYRCRYTGEWVRTANVKLEGK